MVTQGFVDYIESATPYGATWRIWLDVTCVCPWCGYALLVTPKVSYCRNRDCPLMDDDFA